MPTSSWYPIYELLTRYGVDHEVAKAAAKNDLRAWELDEIATFLKKVKRPSRSFCYFRHSFPTESKKRWWAGPPPTAHTDWISAPRSLIDQSARERSALCINEQGQWSLRTSGYVALSHVWIEGLQRDKEKNGVNSQKVDAIFALRRSSSVQAVWVGTDVLVIPSGANPGSALEDEMITLDVINNMPQIYSRADAVVIIDAMLLQLHSTDLTDVAVGLACGNWATRVWTYQEIKLAKHALILTANGSYNYKTVVDHLKVLEDRNYTRYHHLWLHIASMMKDDIRGLSIPDIVMSCGTRRSGKDVDYARAFFPVLGLKWEYGMTREEGMQKIYLSHPHHSSRIACFYGAPRMSIMPAWAPSSFNNLEGYVTKPMSWEKRGLRGEWFALRIRKVQNTFVNGGRFVFEFVLDCSGDTTMQCACAPNEDTRVSQAYCSAVERGQCYVLSAQPSADAATSEWARTALLVEKAQVREGDGFEAAVYCAAIIPTRNQHADSKETILLRHGNPTVDGDLWNQLHYMWHGQEGDSQPAALPQQVDESELHVAVRAGDPSKVIGLVEAGAKIDSFDANGWSPLHLAAARDNCEILRYLLCQFPNIELRSRQMNEDTPLSFAALNGRKDSAEILLEFGADIHTRNTCNYTPIMVAACEQNAEVVQTLLDFGANPNDETGFDGSALLLASGAGKWRLPTLRALIEGGANTNPHHTHNITPMHKIAQFGGAEEMAYLLNQGCKADISQRNGITPLILAIQRSKRECVRLLLNAAANRNTVTESSDRPIHYAARCPDWQIMQMLLENNDVELNAQTEPQKKTALHIACEAVNMTVVKILLNAGADPNIKDASGNLLIELLKHQLESASSKAGSSSGSPSRQLPSPSKASEDAPPLPPRAQSHVELPILPPRPSRDNPPPLPPRPSTNTR